MTKAEKEIELAQRVAEQVAAKEGISRSALVWMGKRAELSQMFIAVENGKETKIAAYYDKKGNVLRLEKQPY